MNRIRDVRLAKGWTLADLAAACEPPTTAQTIGRLETGMRGLSVRWLERIAAALGVQRDTLLVAGPEEQTPMVVARLTAEGADETLEAMALGAGDFVPKPRGAVSLEIDAVADTLVEKVRAASFVRISRVTRLRERLRAKTASAVKKRRVIPKQGAPKIPVAPLPVGSPTRRTRWATGWPRCRGWCRQHRSGAPPRHCPVWSRRCTPGSGCSARGWP